MYSDTFDTNTRVYGDILAAVEEWAAREFSNYNFRWSGLTISHGMRPGRFLFSWGDFIEEVRASNTSKDALQVAPRGSHPVTVSTYMTDLRDCKYKDVTDYGGDLGSIRILRDFWDANGKTFKFMNLPQELRLDIYAYAFGDEIAPHTIRRCRFYSCPGHENLHLDRAYGLLRACKQVYQEIDDHFLFSRQTTWKLHHTSVMYDLALQTPRRFERIKSLDLDLGHLSLRILANDIDALQTKQPTSNQVAHPCSGKGKHTICECKTCGNGDGKKRIRGASQLLALNIHTLRIHAPKQETFDAAPSAVTVADVCKVVMAVMAKQTTVVGIARVKDMEALRSKALLAGLSVDFKAGCDGSDGQGVL